MEHDLNSRRDISLEIRLPISATDPYFRMTRLLLESIRHFGGPIARSARCVITLSGDMPARDLSRECAWAEQFDVDFRWCDRAGFEDLWYHATILERMRVETTADVVLLADADTFCTGDFDNAIVQAHDRQQVLGLIAPRSPFVAKRTHRRTPSEIWWARIFDAAGLDAPSLDHQHPGWGYGYDDPNHRCCPFYLNGGFILAPAHAVQQIGASFRSDLRAVAGVYDTIYKSQIATAVGIARHGLEHDVLGWQYNCPPGVSDERLMAQDAGPDPVVGAEDVKMFHYLGRAEINKRHFRSQRALARLLRRDDLGPTASVLQRKLRTVNDAITGRDA